MIEELENILEYTDFEDVEKDLKAAGYENVPDEIETEDDCGDYSTDVTWECNFVISKNDKEFKIYLTGTAIAEISYERWVDTFGYVIDDFNIEESK